MPGKVKDKISSEYFSNLNIGYDEWFKKPFSNYVRSRQFINFHEFIQGGKSFLEVGCGTGKFISQVDSKVKIGIDSSKEMLTICKQKYPETVFILASSNNLPFADSSFDSIVMLNVFQYLEQPEKTLRELYRIAKPGGKILFSVFTKHSISLNPFRFFVRRKLFGENLPIVTFYNLNEISKMLDGKNFNVKGSGIRPPFESKLLFHLIGNYLNNFENKHYVHPFFGVEMYFYLNKFD